MPMPLHAMLLAAGRGARMRPLTDHTPKPLLPVGGKALIEWHLERLAAAGIHQVVINHAWLGEQIEQQLGDGRRYGVHIDYSAEGTALETAAGIKKALPLLPAEQPFLVISADVWTDWNAALALYMAHSLHEHKALAHLLLVPNPDHNPNGDFSLTANGIVTESNGHNTYTYSGIGVFSPAFFDATSATEPTALREPLYAALQSEQVLGTVYQGEWTDVGTPERLQNIAQRLANKA